MIYWIKRNLQYQTNSNFNNIVHVEDIFNFITILLKKKKWFLKL